jgi:hypothetical protein
LFRPQTALRIRFNQNTDTPLPPDEPAGQNPPDGAIIDYSLKSPARGEVTLEILDGAGKTVRRYSSNDKFEEPKDEGNVPRYWIRPPQRLATSAGMHRFLWDVRYTLPPGVSQSYPIAAVYQSTVKHPLGPWAFPGTYTVKLTVNGKSYTQPITVTMDPRVKASAAALQQQFEQQRALADALTQAAGAEAALRELRRQLGAVKTQAPAGAVADAIAALDKEAGALLGSGGGFRGRGGDASDSLTRVSGQLQQLYSDVDEVDAEPTSPTLAAIAERRSALAGLLARVEGIRSKDVPALNERLKQANLKPLTP